MQISSKYRRWAVGACLAGALAAGRPAVSAIEASGELQDNAQLEALARSEASLRLPALTPHERLVAGPISPMTRLGR